MESRIHIYIQITEITEITETPPTKISLRLHHQDKRRIYNTLTVLAWLMDVISPNHHWKVRLDQSLATHDIDTSNMGFPEHWKTKPA